VRISAAGAPDRIVQHVRAHLTPDGRGTIWLAFLATQLLDGVFTSTGVRLFGTQIEGNPLIVWYAQHIGPAFAIWGAKAFAAGCGTILYVNGKHEALAAVTVFYSACAVVPWIALFSGLIS
jgi:hypothetical protein